MILCPTYGFAFVHVPKCAGSSVRRQIETCDLENTVFGRVGRHPVLGKIDYGHIPLSVLREHFTDAYAFLMGNDCYAVVRDPLARFGSAVRQTLWAYHKKPMTLYSKQELREETARIMDDVAKDIDALPYRLTFFQRQGDFIRDRDQTVVKNVYAIEHVDQLLEEIGARVGRRLDLRMRANQNVSLRYKSIGGIAYRVNDLLFRYAPGGLHKTIKQAALPFLARKQDAAAESGLLDLPEVCAFVSEHYAADDEIYREALAARSGSKAS